MVQTMGQPTQLSQSTSNAQVRRRQVSGLQAELDQASLGYDNEDLQAMEQQTEQMIVQSSASHSASVAPGTTGQRRQTWDSSSLSPFITGGRFDNSADSAPMAVQYFGRVRGREARYDVLDLQFGQTADFGRRWSRREAQRRQASNALYYFLTGNGYFGEMGDTDHNLVPTRAPREQVFARREGLWNLAFGNGADAESIGAYVPPAFSAGQASGHRSSEARYDAGGLHLGQTAYFGRRWSLPSGDAPDLSSLRFDAGGFSGYMGTGAF